jgi:1-acyl-sn-glycerol-3-phosphate acyltransferase
MGRNNIEKWDWRYAFLKHYVNFSFRSYFKSLTVRGKENIPKDSPVIFAPNHQNALMDALAILYTTNDQPVFLARSDIFKKGLISKILTFLKILPIYRIRDGYGNLKLNDFIIKKIHDILSKNHYLVIFPEGNHGDKRMLRSLKKGISRIAFQSEEEYGYDLGIKIVPVGLEYSNYYNFREELFVNFGKPIDLSEFFDMYKESPSKAHLALLRELSKELKQFMIHIENKEYYETIDSLTNIYQTRMKEWLKLPSLKQPHKYQADKKLIAVCEKTIDEEPERFKELDIKTKEYRKLLSENNLHTSKIGQKRNVTGRIVLNLITLIVASPVFLYGWINNLLPYFPAYHFSQKMKDPQFISTIKYGIGILTFPIFYLIQTLACHFIFENIYITLGYLVSLPITGLIAYYYARMVYATKLEFRLRKLTRKKAETYKTMLQLKKEIINKVDEWVSSFGIGV